jgi:hypothetical protein
VITAQAATFVRDLFRRIKHDFDPTLAEVLAAWEATTAIA